MFYQVSFLNNKRKCSLCGNTFAVLLPWESSLFIFPQRLKTCVLVCEDIYLNVWAFFGKKDGISLQFSLSLSLALIAFAPAETQTGFHHETKCKKIYNSTLAFN